MVTVKEVFFDSVAKKKQNKINEDYKEESIILNKIIDTLIDNLGERFENDNGYVYLSIDFRNPVKFSYETNIFGKQPRYKILQEKLLEGNWKRDIFNYHCGGVIVNITPSRDKNIYKISGLNKNKIEIIVNTLKILCRENEKIDDNTYVKIRKLTNKLQLLNDKR